MCLATKSSMFGVFIFILIVLSMNKKKLLQDNPLWIFIIQNCWIKNDFEKYECATLHITFFIKFYKPFFFFLASKWNILFVSEGNLDKKCFSAKITNIDI